MWYKNLLWALILVSTSSVAIAQHPITDIAQFLSSKPGNAKFFIGKIKKANTHQVSRQNPTSFSRKLSNDYYVLSAADTANFEVLGAANNDWKCENGILITALRFPCEFILSVIGNGTYDLSSVYSKSKIIRQEGSAVHVSIASHGDFDSILNDDRVVFIKRFHRAREESPNSFQDVAVNKINLVHFLHPDISGEGIAISVKEKSPDTTDIDLKNRLILSEFADPDVSLHANLIATIIAGGGNTHPNTKGAAWESNIVSTSYNNLLPDNSAILFSHNVSVQNHSYGTVIENYYGPEALSYDQQISDHPTLLHVFSAGNSGESTAEDGPYAGVSHFANLTGNMKMAKNVLIVGGHYSDFVIDSRNSRGPAYDGRIRPEVIAFGPEGTSDAAAFVSGITALLQHTYKMKYDSLPHVDLIKASIAVTADDVGALGPDYISGFGAINAHRAIESIRNGFFAQGQIAGHGSESFSLPVPHGVSRMRVALCWVDPPAAAGDATALVNNLDLSITQGAQTWLPWILSTFPNVDSLNAAAKKGKDHLNNIELVSVADPAPGMYQLHVTSDFANGMQRFAIAYWFDYKNTFLWTYPTSADPVEAGAEIIFRWEQNHVAESGSLEIQISGETLLIREVNLAEGFVSMALPDVSGVAHAIMKIDGTNYDTTEFVISSQRAVKVEFDCAESALISWRSEEGTSEYKVFNLGSRYMEPIALTNDTMLFIDKSDFSNFYFAVAPVFNGSDGMRSATYNVTAQGVKCYFINLLANISEGGQAKIILNTSTTFNIAGITWQKLSPNGFMNLGESAAQNELQYVFFDTGLTPGVSTYRALIRTQDNQMITTDSAVLYYADDATYSIFPNPILKDFESLQILSRANDLSIVFYDVNGRLVISQPVVTDLSRLNIKDLFPGIYYYSFKRGSDIVSSGKLLVK